MNLDNMATGASNVRLNRFLDSAIGIVEHNSRITRLKKGREKRPGGVLKNDGGGSSSVIDNRDFINMVSVDKGLDNLASLEDGGL